MPRIADRDKEWSENPIQNVYDLFQYICRTLKCGHEGRKNKLRFSLGTLTVEYGRRIKGVDISEVLHIAKTWGPRAEEKISYHSKYVEQKSYEADTRKKLINEPGGDWAFRTHNDQEGRDRYLSNEMFVDSLYILQAPVCNFQYETTDIGHGLRTLARLKIAPGEPVDEDDQDIFATLYSEMEKKAEWLLKSQLGEDKKEWKSALRRRKVKAPMRFKKKFETVYPPWNLGYYLVDLCKIYANGHSSTIPRSVKSPVEERAGK